MISPTSPVAARLGPPSPRAPTSAARLAAGPASPVAPRAAVVATVSSYGRGATAAPHSADQTACLSPATLRRSSLRSSGPASSAALAAGLAGTAARAALRHRQGRVAPAAASIDDAASDSTAAADAAASVPAAEPTPAAEPVAAAAAGAASGPSPAWLAHVPNALTVARVAAIPFFMAVFYADAPWASRASAGVFAAAAFTDWLDGYLARKLKVHSDFGAFLDPVADKLMVAAALVLLCGKPPVVGPCTTHSWLLPVASTAIIGRELAMSALREWAARAGPAAVAAAAVSWAGKVKTALQMVAVTLLLAARDGSYWIGPGVEIAAVAGPALLWAAAALSLLSLGTYWQAISKHL